MKPRLTQRVQKWCCRFIVIAMLAWAAVPCLAEDQSPAAAEVAKQRLNFEDHIVPIFKTHCFRCHGEKVKKAGLDLRRRSSIVKGGDSGQALFAGKPVESLVVNRVTSGEMPPDEKTRITEKEIATLKAWVSAGAAIKGAKEAPLVDAGEDREVTDDDRRFWAFQPPLRPSIPSVKSAAQVRTAVDAFLLARLEQSNAKFNSDASKRVLIRRVYFDVLGLPPSPADVEEFVRDDRPDAYERLVDRLLASPRFGERWGRRWLDVAGYADSDGYLAADRLRPEAWRYRDYVIRAHNEDKPFDRFILEQIAGDELVDWRRADEITPAVADDLIATGFLRTALDPTYAGYAEPLECHKVVADTVQIVSSTFLGLTVHCARCHSHKFDPISQTDYYRLHSLFLASYDPQRWQVSLARHIPLATESELEANRKTQARLKELQAAIEQLTKRTRDRFLDERLAHIADAKRRGDIKAALLIDSKKRNANQKDLVKKHANGLKFAEPDLAQRFPKFAAQVAALRNAIAAEQALMKKVVQVRGLQDLDDKPPTGKLLIRGDFKKPGKAVEPGVPVVLSPEGFQFSPQPAYKTSGRRLALGKWLIDRRNPLTARVHVNRVWDHYFGRGLVETVDDFGKAGSKPSHPELLDWLAVEFQENGWSRKALHRLLLTSSAYRQSSAPNAALAESDPDNILLGSWRPRRHDGEVIRDSILAVAGKLHRNMYGAPVPVQRHGDGRVVVADSPVGNRPSVYVIVRRSQPVTILDLFDTPKMEINCTRRTQSIVVTQPLAMLHSKFAETNARVLVDRLSREAPNDELHRIDLAYQLLFARGPRVKERTEAVNFLNEVSAAYGGKPDAKASRRAAWDQFALVLLNSNEFLYVR